MTRRSNEKRRPAGNQTAIRKGSSTLGTSVTKAATTPRRCGLAPGFTDPAPVPADCRYACAPGEVCVARLVDGLSRRRAAALRLPALANGIVDPWVEKGAA